MELGMVGLGRMGANLVRRVQSAGHRCVVFDVDPGAVKALEKERCHGRRLARGSRGQAAGAAGGVGDGARREITGKTVSDLAARLEAGDVIIDGGNSYYRDDIARAEAVRDRGIHYVDVGTSGGVWGLERGYCLMIGGEHEVMGQLQPVFEAIAPGVAAAGRTPGRTGDPARPSRAICTAGRTGRGIS